MFNNLQDVMSVIIPVIASLVWLIRLESKVGVLERDMALLIQKQEEATNKLLDEIFKLAQSMSRIEGKCSLFTKRSDIEK